MFDDLFQGIGVDGGGSFIVSEEQAAELAKTLPVGHANGIQAPGGLTGAAAQLMESVDGTLKSVTFSQKSLVFWPSVPQDRAYSTVEQFNRTNSYGDGGSPYIAEGGSPVMNDENYDRHSAKTAIFATRRGVSLVQNLVRHATQQDAEAVKAQAGTLWILEKVERELYWGMSDFSNAGAFDGAMDSIPQKLQNLNLSGLEHQIRKGDSDYSAQDQAFNGYGGADSVVRSVGDVLDESQIEDLATQLSENHSQPSMLDWAPRTMSDFVRQFFPKERVNALGVLDGRAGYVVRTLATTAGDIGLRPNVFLRTKRAPKSQDDREGVPGAPADLTNAATTSIVAGGGTMDQAAGSSGFVAGDIYNYEVTACNEQGEGVSSLVSVDVTISTASYKSSFLITKPSAGNAATHYAIYRSANAGTGAREFIGYVKKSGDITTFTDNGKRSPGSAKAYMMDMRPESLMWRQLAPLLKVHQAPIGLAKEFILCLIGTLLVFAPRNNGIFENVIRSA